MIIILSTEGDTTTDEVCKWLEFYNQNYKVIYSNDLNLNIDILNFSLSNAYQYLEQVFNCKINEITAIWCRKWDIYKFKPNTEELPEQVINRLGGSCSKEVKKINNFLFSLLPSDKIINHFFNNRNSKLEQLLVAKECELLFPETHIVSSKESLKAILNNKSSFITKAIDEGIGLNFEENSYTTFTARIDLEKIETEKFLPSLIQKEIEKDYEVRTFVLGSKIFSMAIFSQGNSKTEIDFRQYDLKNPNKQAPFKLPLKIEKNILNFCNKMNLQTGSIDFIVDKENNFYFLEINPFGQFGMVSKPNNYNLEHEFAKFLIEYGSIK